MPTLRELTGASNAPNAISESALILIDCQNTYTEGVMKLEGVEEALNNAKILLDRARAASRPIFHIMHDAGKGSPYDVNEPIGKIADIVAPKDGEPVVTKAYPSSFENTNLQELIDATGTKKLILAGFMTHCCVNSTARAGFNKGYQVTVVGNATATRDLPNPSKPGEVIPAQQTQDASLAALCDLFSVIAPSVNDIPE
mmetsp:Transcript_12648/g.26764  ORF Transcript_12648/g.26764 Transcript_12648/m.26764 type:complete len:199 (+) Transcript_12648:13-609(+)